MLHHADQRCSAVSTLPDVHGPAGHPQKTTKAEVGPAIKVAGQQIRAGDADSTGHAVGTCDTLPFPIIQTFADLTGWILDGGSTAFLRGHDADGHP
ncbi:hypothetical protein B0H65DRAFT_545163 [Neurospora tetraspora]|uniref:Uncharacterized protein n=1 Tax=Neurospora tetraspora TaxID=94610 RepID=A0AAE0JQG6_9PEZI|nr:hypothetical protein B0H65DRAFT_545163 [Neurospora tetraspora]